MEGQEAGEEDIEDDAAGPEVCLGAVVPASAENLRGHVRWSSALGVEKSVVVALFWECGEAEVGDLEVAIVIEEEVLRLEVAVGDAAAVAELDGAYELAEVAAGLVLGERPMEDAREELAAAHVLHDEEDA